MQTEFAIKCKRFLRDIFRFNEKENSNFSVDFFSYAWLFYNEAATYTLYTENASGVLHFVVHIGIT